MDFKNICVGIPSYIPDGENRARRLEKVKETLTRIDEKLNIPIIIIAQNWKGEIEPKQNWIIYEYDKLGITGARIKLREKFLESNFNQLIMLDDEIIFEIKNRNRFLAEISSHEVGWSQFGPTIAFAAISKSLYQKIEFPDVDVNRDHIFEDQVFLAILKEYYAEKRYTMSKDYYDYDYSINCTTHEPTASTWFNGDDLLMHECTLNTRKYIKENIKKKEEKPRTYMGGGYFGL